VSPQHSDPAASGSSVPLNCRPMRAPRNAPLKVEIKPCSDAPMPATEATGSIAIAPKLDSDSAKHAMVADWKTTNSHRCSTPRAATSECRPVMTRYVSSAVCEIRRMPKRSTILELRNAAIPMVPAHSANMVGMSVGR